MRPDDKWFSRSSQAGVRVCWQDRSECEDALLKVRSIAGDDVTDSGMPWEDGIAVVFESVGDVRFMLGQAMLLGPILDL